MTQSEQPPDLIISLSHNAIGLQLSGRAEKGRTAWSASYPIEVLFQEDQLADVLDRALTENPFLLDTMDQVDVLFVDFPHLYIPSSQTDDSQWRQLADRYLRRRDGDQWVLDPLSDDSMMTYPVPSVMVNLIREYFANSGHIHLSSVLWTAITQHLSPEQKEGNRLYYFLLGDTLLVLAGLGDKLTLTRACYAPQKEDLRYYCIAYDKLMQPIECMQVTVVDLPVEFRLESLPGVRVSGTISLPEIQTLIAGYRSCAS